MPLYRVCMGFFEGQKNIRYPGTGVTDGFKLPCECWELNLGPLKKQPVLLTIGPKGPIKASKGFFFFFFLKQQQWQTLCIFNINFFWTKSLLFLYCECWNQRWTPPCLCNSLLFNGICI